MEITKREILASLVIMALWMCLGIFISGKIDEWQQDKNAEYDRAARITEKELFKHGMDTNLGNAFVYGELKAVDPVTYSEISGAYSYVKKVKEEYTMHTRTVTKTRRGTNGKTETYTETETYWSWDYAGKETKKSKTMMFLGYEFPGIKFDLPPSEYIQTIKKTSCIRYKYYGVPEKMKGTIYTRLKDRTISDSSEFYNEIKPEKVVEMLEVSDEIIVFWIIWLILMVAILYGFYYLDNRWLE